MTVLQVFITYTPGLNEVIFSMDPMDGKQWVIVAIASVIVFIVMEFEKCVRNFLTSMKYDTDDIEIGIFDENVEPDKSPLPSEVDRFGRNEATR